ncbi:MAG: TlpA family protein disulfide reductase [Alphaproteobacteria bacterium]|nr:TlpA family protein disulfide reductase [Alphaproteobacteria bacterium]
MKPLEGTTPNTPVETHDGGMATLAELVDRPMLVNFWASWCPPCVHELPSLKVLDAALKGHDMAVMLVGLDRKGRPFAEQFLADRGIEIPRRGYDKTGDLPRALGIKVMPTSYLVGTGGALIGIIEGPLDWGQPDVIAAVNAALKP